MVYRRYANPKEIINMYIKRRQFGKFVTKLFEAKRKEETEKLEHDNDWQLWVMYTRILPEKPFPEWKKEVMGDGQGGSGDEYLTNEGIQNIFEGLFPKK